jgi:hypothetical protein
MRNSDLPLRDRIIDAVRYGLLTPKHAEKAARRLGLPPFASKPGTVVFDPTKETWWSLVMAVAWIAWRATEKVREYWDEPRRDTWDWVPRFARGNEGEPVLSGYELQQRRPATPLLLLIDEAEERNVPRYVFGLDSKTENARSELWKALGDGLLQATGIRADGGSRVTIPAAEWNDLDWYEAQAEDPVRVSRSKLAVDGYDYVRVRSAEIASLWPPQHSASTSLPRLVVPNETGHMTLFQAAQWIGTKGGTVSIEPSDASIWKDAFDQLLSRAASDELRVTGVRDGERVSVKGDTFIAIAVDYPFADTPRGLRNTDDLYLRSYAYVDDERWRAGFDDSLCDRNGPKITRLMVAKSDVARWWPFGAFAECEPREEPRRTGLAGRSTSWHLVEAEFLQRHQAGEASRAISEEADRLAAWLKRAHPNAPSATPKTISNRLRDDHRAKFDLTRNKDRG